MLCSNCGVENPPGAKFCHECGTSFARVCPNCGTTVLPVAKFCNECGTTLVADEQPPSVPSLSEQVTSPAVVTGSTTELRHVSVLFCDLVGFTPLAEKRDPEEVASSYRVTSSSPGRLSPATAASSRSS